MFLGATNSKHRQTLIDLYSLSGCHPPKFFITPQNLPETSKSVLSATKYSNQGQTILDLLSAISQNGCNTSLWDSNFKLLIIIDLLRTTYGNLYMHYVYLLDPICMKSSKCFTLLNIGLCDIPSYRSLCNPAHRVGAGTARLGDQARINVSFSFCSFP